MLEEVLNKLDAQTVVILRDEELSILMEETEIIEEMDTCFRDKVRILGSQDIFIIQEKSDKDEILIRKADSLEEGQKFIRNRLAVYENMWNGCGCKVDYYK
ncbi:MAG: hypothetical protein KAV45_07240 [Calditrichia bacterium]|nr:hypothetical protein [Calditrichia bacterium]